MYGLDWGEGGASIETARSLGPAEHEVLLEARHFFANAPAHAVVWVDTDAGGTPLGLVRDGDAYVAQPRYERRVTIDVPEGRPLGVSVDSRWRGMTTHLYSSGRRPMTEAQTVDATFLGPDATVHFELKDSETRNVVAEGVLGRADALSDLIQLAEGNAKR